MDKNKIIPILGKDIENIEVQIKLLSENIVALTENLVGLKKTYTLLVKEEEDMAREITKENVKVIQLKNGQVNIPYEEIINLEKFHIPKDTIIDFVGIDQIKWNQEDSKFEGELNYPGEFNGKLSFWENLTDKENNKPKLERQVHILINADPKSLWKTIDPPKEGPFFKDNTDFSFEKINNRISLGASIRGKSHAQKGTFRDDDFEIHAWENGWVLQVVSDGAGSAEYSREGSKIACKSVLSKISEFIDSEKLQLLEDLIVELQSKKDTSKEHAVEEISDLKGNIIDDTNKTSEEKNNCKLNNKGENIINDNVIKKKVSGLVHELTVIPAYFAFLEIKKLAEETNNTIKKFSTTILFTISKEFEFGTIVISFSIGDGAIAVITEKEGILLMKPDGGEYSGQTRFITCNELFKDPKINDRSNLRLFKDKLEAIILMTDGISDPKFETDNNLMNSEMWLKFWADLKPILNKDEPCEKEIIEWMDFHEKGEYDDRTLTILY